MTRLRALQSSLLLGTALSLGIAVPLAQVSKHDVKTQAVMTAQLASDAASFERLLAVPPRIVDTASAAQALSEMGLSENGRDALSWSSRSGGAGNYVFNKVTGVDSDGTPFSFETVSVSGLRMEAEDPVFDHIDMRGLSLKHTDGTLSVERLSMSDLQDPLATAFVRTFHDFDMADVLEDQFEDKDLGIPGALYLEDLSMDIDDGETVGTISLSAMGWGESEITGKGRVLLRGVNLAAIDEDSGAPVNISLGAMSADGVDMDVFREVVRKIDFEDIDEGTFDDISSTMYENPYQKIYDQYAIDNFSVKFDSLVVGLEHYGSNVTKVGDILTYKTLMKPLTVSFSGETQSPEIAEMQEFMTEAGFEDISLTAGSTTIMNETYDRFQVEDGYMEFQNNARMDFVMAGKGLTPFYAAMGEIEDMDEASDEQMMALFEGLSLDDMDLSLTDMSLMGKIFDIAAKDAGVTPDLMKTKAKAMLMMGAMMAQNPAQMTFASRSAEAVSALIDQGGTLEIKIRPEAPLSMDSFADFDPSAFDPADYGLTISHRK